MERLHPPSQPLSFVFDDDSGELIATLVSMDDTPPVDMGMLKQALIDAGFGEFHLYEGALAAFIAASETATDVLTMIIGKRGDGKFSLTVAEDLMSASLTLIPPQGGKPVAHSAVMDALRDEGIVHGIKSDRIAEALAAGECQNVVIAEGDPQQPPVPTQFESQLEDSRAVDELAVIEYADLTHLLLVNPGDPLMRRIPAIQGKDGMDIKGQIIPAAAISDTPFSEKIEGAAPHPDDPNLLVATFAGQPTLLASGVSVNPVVQVADVDLGTGNIEFEGTLRVTGDVKSGMRVKVSGDVIVDGMVEAAELTAGGSVSVRGGIVGNANTSTAGGAALPPTSTKIRCKGSVQALFMEHVHIEAGESISVGVSVTQCDLIAGNEIVVGRKGSRAGQIIGGRVQAGQLVNAAVLGSPIGIRTLIQVGSDPFLAEERAAHEKMLQSKQDEMKRVLQVIAYFQRDPSKAAGGVGEKVENTRRQLANDIERLTAEQKQFNERNVSADKARVNVSKTVHEGVELRIGKHAWHVRSDYGAGTASVVDDRISFSRGV